MAAHNEEKVIRQKIKSVFSGKFPSNKIEFLIGTDNCSDSTIEIIRDLQKTHPQIQLYEFFERQGKIKIINQLVAKSNNDLLILTDSNVLFHSTTIENLLKHFKNEVIGLVDSRMINTGLKSDGISIQEKTYIGLEVETKNAEGKVWGSMMGPFGGCFAIRKKAFSKIPIHFLVDDFFLNMETLRKGFKCINESSALVYEDVSNNLTEEFRRKIRISAGNFQNLMYFFNLLFRFNSISFSFLSHKILRWLTPIILIIIASTCIFLIHVNPIYLYVLVVILLVVTLVLTDLFLKKININITFLRFLTHFSAMNLALLIGLINYLRGIESSVWEPTKRLQ
jgi:cellulose synthase/poly-beta-1,6-N-acetylglucosamine synthase-like glycosyltransferase